MSGNGVEYLVEKLDVVLSFEDLLADEEKKMIYAFDNESSPNIRCIKIKNGGLLELEENKISSPKDEHFHLGQHLMVYVYNCLIVVFFRSKQCGDIWVLDLRNETWYKSKYQIPYTQWLKVIDGRDNFVYFIYHGQDPAAFNYKVSLFDIIPSEVYDNDKGENYILVHGFMHGIAKGSELVCPDSLISMIAMYYSKLLYV